MLKPFTIVLLLTLTACATQPSVMPLPLPAPVVVVSPLEDLSDLKERLRTALANNAVLRGERERCRRRLDEVGKQFAVARVQVLRLLEQVEGLKTP